MAIVAGPVKARGQGLDFDIQMTLALTHVLVVMK